MSGDDASLFDDDDGVPVFDRIDDLEALLRGARDVPRDVRRAVMSDARSFARRLVQVDGCAPERVRYRVCHCLSCDRLELCVFDAAGVRRRVCH